MYNTPMNKVSTLSFEKQEDFSRFGKTFQESLCRLILTDRTFADQIGEVLDFKFFELKYLQVFCKKVYEYKEKYKTHPTSEVMMTIVRTEMDKEDDALSTQVRNYLARILTKTGNDEAEYIKDTSLDFCKKQKLKEAILKSIVLIESSSFEEIRGEIDSALNLGTDNNFGYDYIKDFEARFVPKHRNPVSTGWPRVDELCRGGLGKGELGVCIAPTGAGKTHMLVHLGSQALKQGKNVVHYSLELSDTIIAGRYDSCLTKFPLSHLLQYKDEILKEVKDIPGHLVIKEYPTKAASVNTLRSHLERLRVSGVNIGLIIVDYGDLLRPDRQEAKRGWSWSPSMRT